MAVCLEGIECCLGRIDERASMTPNNVRRFIYIMTGLAVILMVPAWYSDSPLVAVIQAAMGSAILASLGWLAGYRQANRDAAVSSVMATLKRLSAKRGGRV